MEANRRKQDDSNKAVWDVATPLPKPTVSENHYNELVFWNNVSAWNTEVDAVSYVCSCIRIILAQKYNLRVCCPNSLFSLKFLFPTHPMDMVWGPVV